MSEWGVELEGVLLGCDDAEALGTLSYPPEGLGLPALRTEDVTYPQRDGVRHFADWYEPRIVTLNEVTVCSDGCADCVSARQKLQQIQKAWSRKCDDVELVVHTDCEPETRMNYSIDPQVDRAGVPTVLATNLHTDPFFASSAPYPIGRDVTVAAGPAGGGPVIRGAEMTYRTLTANDPDDGPLTLSMHLAGDVSVVPGETLDLSFLLRAPDGPVQAAPMVDWRDSFGGSAGVWNGAATTVDGSWTTVADEVVVPEGVASAVLAATVEGFAAPEVLSISGVLATLDGFHEPVFSGSSPDVGGFDFSWTGTPNNSASVALATPPLEWPDGVVLNGQGGLIVGEVGNPDVEAPDGTPWTAYLVGGGTVSGTICGPEPVWPTTGVIERLMVGEGAFFDGDTTDTSEYIYSWTGTPGASTSLSSVNVDRAVVGPFGIVGRPRVATHIWQRGTDCAVMLLRFDATDHRMFILDGSGQPGSGVISATAYPSTEDSAVCFPLCFTGGGDPEVMAFGDVLTRTNLHPNPFVGDSAAGWTLGGRAGVTQTVEPESGPDIPGRPGPVPWRGISFAEGTGTPTVYTNGDGSPMAPLVAGDVVRIAAHVLSAGVGVRLGLRVNLTGGGSVDVWGLSAFPGEGWTELSDTVTVPADAVDGRLMVQFTETDIRAGIQLGVTGAVIGADGQPFDGDNVDTTEYRYEWTGTPYQSSSQEWQVSSDDGDGDSICFDTDTGSGAGSVTVDNIGTECSQPVICFHGQLTNPVLENMTTGETIGYNGTIGATASPVCVDTATRNAEQDGAPRNHLITGNASLEVMPGVNEFRLVSYSSSDDGYVTIEFRPSVVSA